MRAALLAALLTTAAFADELPRLPAARLCVTRGALAPLGDDRVAIVEPKVRAVVPGSDGNRALLRFWYRGSTTEVAPLGSGELRRQIGLKLRAQDGCNLLYVMWRFDPKPGIVVSLKRNPGQRTHAECSNHGYRNLRGTVAPAPLVTPGTTHTLEATLANGNLRVRADGALVWQGDVGAEAEALSGPVGLRSDNGRFELELRAVAAGSPATCRASDEE